MHTPTPGPYFIDEDRATICSRCERTGETLTLCMFTGWGESDRAMARVMVSRLDMLAALKRLLASTDQKTRDEISNYFRTGILPDAELAMNGGASFPSMLTPPSVSVPGGFYAAGQMVERQLAVGHAEQRLVEREVDVGAAAGAGEAHLAEVTLGGGAAVHLDALHAVRAGAGHGAGLGVEAEHQHLGADGLAARVRHGAQPRGVVGVVHGVAVGRDVQVLPDGMDAGRVAPQQGEERDRERE